MANAHPESAREHRCWERLFCGPYDEAWVRHWDTYSRGTWVCVPTDEAWGEGSKLRHGYQNHALQVLYR